MQQTIPWKGIPCLVSIHIREWGAVQRDDVHPDGEGGLRFQFTFVSGVPCNIVVAIASNWNPFGFNSHS